MSRWVVLISGVWLGAVVILTANAKMDYVQVHESGSGMLYVQYDKEVWELKSLTWE